MPGPDAPRESQETVKGRQQVFRAAGSKRTVGGGLNERDSLIATESDLSDGVQKILTEPCVRLDVRRHRYRCAERNGSHLKTLRGLARHAIAAMPPRVPGR
jgi:hypothetical protein